MRNTVVLLLLVTLSCAVLAPAPEAPAGVVSEPTAAVATMTPSLVPSPPLPTATPEPAVPAQEGGNLAQTAECQFFLEVAESPEERAQGLMERIALATDAGMLFVYGEEALLRFWMRNTLIPLDILFMDSTGAVVEVQTMFPEPRIPPEQLTIYTSRAPARYALEINAGRASACRIVVGTQVSLTLE